jgi:hypothetical protein
MTACLLVDGAGTEPRGGPFRFCLPARGRVMALGAWQDGRLSPGIGAVVGWWRGRRDGVGCVRRQ